MSTHRRSVRPRYGRIAALATSVTVSTVAALAGLGVLATGSASDAAAAQPASYLHAKTSTTQASASQGNSTPAADPTAATRHLRTRMPAAGSPSYGPTALTALPERSGTGRRVVFSQHLQRVWLVGANDDTVQRTYPVSGSVTHNLQPGTYSVYSRSRWAVGVDDSGVMQYFVRFTQGPTGAAIGFHTIPTKDGVPLQSQASLGTPQSHGCIRQATPDAIALWDFAPEGTKVVVVS
jgi:lipoprotein-anchoring transpeptidase ErfK/SrfK